MFVVVFVLAHSKNIKSRNADFHTINYNLTLGSQNIIDDNDNLLIYKPNKEIKSAFEQNDCQLITNENNQIANETTQKDSINSKEENETAISDSTSDAFGMLSQNLIENGLAIDLDEDSTIENLNNSILISQTDNKIDKIDKIENQTDTSYEPSINKIIVPDLDNKSKNVSASPSKGKRAKRRDSMVLTSLKANKRVKKGIRNHKIASDRFDFIIFMGDLNYRVNGTRAVVDSLIEKNMLDVLRHNDQLTVAREYHQVFQGFKEANISFPPTYKFDKNSDVYDTSEKARVPSWTDRILYRCNLQQIQKQSYKNTNANNNKKQFQTNNNLQATTLTDVSSTNQSPVTKSPHQIAWGSNHESNHDQQLYSKLPQPKLLSQISESSLNKVKHLHSSDETLNTDSIGDERIQDGATISETIISNHEINRPNNINIGNKNIRNGGKTLKESHSDTNLLKKKTSNKFESNINIQSPQLLKSLIGDVSESIIESSPNTVKIDDEKNDEQDTNESNHYYKHKLSFRRSLSNSPMPKSNNSNIDISTPIAKPKHNNLSASGKKRRSVSKKKSPNMRQSVLGKALESNTAIDLGFMSLKKYDSIKCLKVSDHRPVFGIFQINFSPNNEIAEKISKNRRRVFTSMMEQTYFCDTLQLAPLSDHTSSNKMSITSDALADIPKEQLLKSPTFQNIELDKNGMLRVNNNSAKKPSSNHGCHYYYRCCCLCLCFPCIQYCQCFRKISHMHKGRIQSSFFEDESPSIETVLTRASFTDSNNASRQDSGSLQSLTNLSNQSITAINSHNSTNVV